MNLPGPRAETETAATSVISTYSILLLSGMLFGMCVSGSVPTETKLWVVVAGTLGLVAYLVSSLAAHKQKQMQLRLATQQVEQRLDRHSHVDHRADSASLSAGTVSPTPA